MIGTLPISGPLLSAMTIPTTGAAPLSVNVAIAGRYTDVVPVMALAPIVAQAVLPRQLVNPPALPPPPSAFPIVQAGMSIPALSPSAPLTSLAPAYYPSGATGASSFSAPPSGFLPAPLPFGTAALAQPIVPPAVSAGPIALLTGAPDPLSFAGASLDAPAFVPSTEAAATAAFETSASAVGTNIFGTTDYAPKWMLAAAGVAAVALVGGLAFGVHRRFGKGRRR